MTHQKSLDIVTNGIGQLSTLAKRKKVKEILCRVLNLPESKKSLAYLHSGIGTATEMAVLLEVEQLHREIALFDTDET